jgi:predicted enzyme related to lactoylglutathione lyase
MAKRAKSETARKPAKAAKQRKAPAKRSSRRAATPAAPRGGVVHWEIQSVDEAKQRAFYAALFGWKIDIDNEGGYGIVAAAGPGSIGGGFAAAPAAGGPRVMIYVGVPSIDEALARVVTLGGQPTMQRTDLGMVIMAAFRDPEGNLIGLVEG